MLQTTTYTKTGLVVSWLGWQTPSQGHVTSHSVFFLKHCTLYKFTYLLTHVFDLGVQIDHTLPAHNLQYDYVTCYARSFVYNHHACTDTHYM